MNPTAEDLAALAKTLRDAGERARLDIFVANQETLANVAYEVLARNGDAAAKADILCINLEDETWHFLVEGLGEDVDKLRKDGKGGYFIAAALNVQLVIAAQALGAWETFAKPVPEGDMRVVILAHEGASIFHITPKPRTPPTAKA